MKQMQLFIAIFFCLISATIIASAQQTQEAQEAIPANIQFDPTLSPIDERDSVEYKYIFFAGDTLYFYAESQDSIIIDYNPALTKTREEVIKIWCDSISYLMPKNDTTIKKSPPKKAKKKAAKDKPNIPHNATRLMHLKIKTMSFASREKMLDQDTVVTRTSTPWQVRTVGIVIDSTGKRHDYFIDIPGEAMVSTGGPFTPEFCPNLGSGKRFENETWLVSDTLRLPENAVPAPMIYQSSLMRAQNDLDTLGRHCLSVRYARTTQGTYYLDAPKEFIHITGILNNGLQMRIDAKDHIPVHIYSTMEQKLVMHPKQEGGNKSLMWHYLTNDYVLDKLVPSPERLKAEKLQKEKAEKERIMLQKKQP